MKEDMSGMKRRRIRLVAAGVLSGAALLMTACGEEEGTVQALYGPPPEESFDSSDNIPVDIYGPPVEDSSFEEGEAEEEEDVLTEDESFDPAENIQACIYGPPEAFGNQ